MEDQKRKYTSAVIIALLFVAEIVGGFVTYQLSAVPSQVYARFNLTDAQFSGIMTSGMIPAIFLSIISGLLVDRFGPKKVIGIALLVTTAALLVRPFVKDYLSMFVVMMFVGFNVMVLSANMSKVVSAVVSPKHLGVVVGLLMMGGTGSMMLSYVLCPRMPGLDFSFWSIAILAVVLTVLWWLLVREKHFAAPQAEETQVSVKESLKVCLKSKNVWVSGIALFFLFGATTVITNFHVVAMTNLGMTETEGGTYGTVLTIGAMVGSVLVPIVCAKMKSLRLPLLVMGLITTASGFLIICGNSAVMYVFSFLNGMLRSGILALLFAYPVQFPEIGPRYAGTAGGVVVTLDLAGAVVLPSYVIVPLCGSNTAAYFYCAAGAYLISTICVFLLPAARSKR